jgi:hypothetical protein
VDDDGRAQTFRRLTAHVAGPDGIAYDIPLEPVGAGAYAATQPLSRPGTYVVTAKDELDNKNVSTTGAVLTAGEELRPTGTDRALLARIASMTGGKSRDTLAGIFTDRSAQRFSYWPLTPWLVAFASIFLLFTVAARRLSLPAFLSRIPEKLRSRAKRRPKQAERSAEEVATTMDRLGKAKDRARTGGAVEGPVPPAQHPPPMAPPAAWRPPPMAQQPARPAARPVVPAPQAQPRISAPPASSGARPLTAAEILLQKRRGRRG